MFEFALARKYLIPRMRQFSASIISLISILVISLVVWLIVVFFSVTNGLQEIWIEKLLALTAPIRMTPTEEYYHSYYYKIDEISEASSYSSKSIHEKRIANLSNPYDPAFDPEIPIAIPKPDLDKDGQLIDPVKGAFAAIESVEGVYANDFEIAFSQLRIRMARPSQMPHYDQSFMNRSSYLSSFDGNNPLLHKTLVDLSPSDFENLLEALVRSSESVTQDGSSVISTVRPQKFRERLREFFQVVHFNEFEVPSFGYQLPLRDLPRDLEFTVIKEAENIWIVKDERNIASWVENRKKHNIPSQKGKLNFSGGSWWVDQAKLSDQQTVGLAPGIRAKSILVNTSIQNARQVSDLRFNVQFTIQNGIKFSHIVPYGAMQLVGVEVAKDACPFWVHWDGEKSCFTLPYFDGIGEGALFPKALREGGLRVGDQGFLSYYATTTSSHQEQRIPIYVAGFFDPGVMPLGGKFVMVNPAVTNQVRSTYEPRENPSLSGIHVRFPDLSEVSRIRSEIAMALKKRGVEKYWDVETYEEYEFTRDMIQQLKSEKTLFSLISIVIIIVACSNIISMLIILVNDKREEIAVMRSMGASSTSIAIIFGSCGLFMGAIGSALGVGLAAITLQKIDLLLELISSFQGHAILNQQYFGDTLPTQISQEALVFVLMATTAISLLAGIVPAVKASLLNPSTILRSDS